MLPGLVDKEFGGSAPAWSPDGSRIAYYRSYDEIWVANADGTNPHLVVEGVEIDVDSSLDWGTLAYDPFEEAQAEDQEVLDEAQTEDQTVLDESDGLPAAQIAYDALADVYEKVEIGGGEGAFGAKNVIYVDWADDLSDEGVSVYVFADESSASDGFDLMVESFTASESDKYVQVSDSYVIVSPGGEPGEEFGDEVRYLLTQ